MDHILCPKRFLELVFIYSATEECGKVILLGDANVCALKWSDPNRKTNKVAELLKNKIEECGMINLEIGETFTSDIVQKNGAIASSALDHIYISSRMETEIRFQKLDNSSTDHLPIKATLTNQIKTTAKMKTITKRSTKFFTKAKWSLSLTAQGWENLGNTENLDEI